MKKTGVISNFIWRFAERCGAQLVTGIVSLLLARILAPADYGRIALVEVFMNILYVFVDCGLCNMYCAVCDHISGGTVHCNFL